MLNQSNLLEIRGGLKGIIPPYRVTRSGAQHKETCVGALQTSLSPEPIHDWPSFQFGSLLSHLNALSVNYTCPLLIHTITTSYRSAVSSNSCHTNPKQSTSKFPWLEQLFDTHTCGIPGMWNNGMKTFTEDTFPIPPCAVDVLGKPLTPVQSPPETLKCSNFFNEGLSWMGSLTLK